MSRKLSLKLLCIYNEFKEKCWMKTVLTLSLSIITFALVQAQASYGRMDINGMRKIQFKMDKKPDGGNFLFASSRGKNDDSYLIVTGKQLESNNWTKESFEFTPKQSGDIFIILSGRYLRGKNNKFVRIWTEWKNISLDGAQLKNSNFNILDSKGLPVDWTSNKNNIIKGKEGISVKTTQQDRVFQKIKVTAGVKVKVAYMVRAVDDKDYALNFRNMANADFKDEKAGDGKGGWSDQGPQDMSGFDTSRRDYKGINFDIIAPVSNDNKAVMVFSSKSFQTNLHKAAIHVDTLYSNKRYLYLLHSSCWNGLKKGQAVANIKINFADGTSQNKTIKSGIDIGDWWKAPNYENAAVVAKKRMGADYGAVFLSKLDINPDQKNIDSIEITGARGEDKTVYIIAGMTLSNKNILLKDNDIIYKESNKWKKVDMSQPEIIAGTALDLSTLNTQKAGANGRLIINSNGKAAFVQTPNTPVRFYGFNGFVRYFRSPWLFADIKNTKTFAGQARKRGYNCVGVTLNEVIFKGHMQGSKKLSIDKQKLRTIDSLLSNLKEEGIYVDLHGFLPRISGQTFWKTKAQMLLGNPDARRLWKYKAEKTLNHVNPFTGLAWKDDPVIINIILNNEVNGGFLWSKREEIEEEATPQWQSWLEGKYKNIEKLNKDWKTKYKSFQSVKLPECRFFYGKTREILDYRQFWSDKTRENYKWCKNIIRDIGYKGIISGDNVSKLIADHAVRWETSDVVSMNTYWAHPVNNKTRINQDSHIEMLGNSWRGNVSSRLFNRPFFISEYNHCYWNKYQYETFLFPAYSAFQNFDGMLIHEAAFSFNDEVVNPHFAKNNAFSVGISPVQLASDFIAVCLFRRGDVASSKHKVEVEFDKAAVLETGNTAVNTEQSKMGLITGFGIGFKGMKLNDKSKHVQIKPDIRLKNVAGTAVTTSAWFMNAEDSNNRSSSLSNFCKTLKTKGILSKDNITNPEKNIFQTDTGQITLYGDKMIMTVVTPMSEVIAMPAKSRQKLDNLEVNKVDVNSAVAVISVDGRQISESKRMVLIFNTRVVNSNTKVSSDERIRYNKGDNPLLMETGTVELSLKNANKENLKLYALTINGTRKEQIPVKIDNGKLLVQINTAKLKDGPTPFFELVTE